MLTSRTALVVATCWPGIILMRINIGSRASGHPPLWQHLAAMSPTDLGKARPRPAGERRAALDAAPSPGLWLSKE